MTVNVAMGTKGTGDVGSGLDIYNSQVQVPGSS